MYNRSEFACHLCFHDRKIQAWAREQSRGRIVCPWCGRRGHLVQLASLAEPFRDVASLYDEVNGPNAFEIGEPLSFLLDDDWDVFSPEIQSLDLAQELLTSILHADLSEKDRYDFPDFHGLFRRQRSSLEDAWDERAYNALQIELPKQIADEPQGSLEVAFEDLATFCEPKRKFYRARVHDDRRRTSRFTSAEVGAPPPEKAKAGRANQDGQPVLYLASNKSTALAEVRPWKGAAVALAEIEVNRELLLVDLARRHSVKSPFFVELLAWKLQLAGLLYRLGHDMSQPVMPHEQAVLYKPTQLLALMIQAAGYDGCIFPSAMGSGKNVVLFDVNAADVAGVDYLRVTQAAFFSSSFSIYDNVYDEGPYDYALAGKRGTI